MTTKKSSHEEVFFSSIHEWRKKSLPQRISTALENHEDENEEDLSSILSSRIDAALYAKKIFKKTKGF